MYKVSAHLTDLYGSRIHPVSGSQLRYFQVLCEKLTPYKKTVNGKTSGYFTIQDPWSSKVITLVSDEDSHKLVSVVDATETVFNKKMTAYPVTIYISEKQ